MTLENLDLVVYGGRVYTPDEYAAIQRALSLLATADPYLIQVVAERLGLAAERRELNLHIVPREPLTGYFMIDTGATHTLLNVRLLGEELAVLLDYSRSMLPTQTASGVAYMASGSARLGVGGLSAEVPVLYGVLESEYHLLGVDALRVLLGDRILLDFSEGMVCGLPG